MVMGWRQEAGDPRNQQKMCARAPAVLSEANVEAHEFRLEFAKETLQSFKNKRDRSRSPLRVGPLSNAARAALDVVCRHDTEARVEDQRATIAQLRQELAAKDVEIADLRIGKGAIGPILASHIIRDDEIRKNTMEMTETVADFVDRVRWLANCVTDNLAWGRHNHFMARNALNHS